MRRSILPEDLKIPSHIAIIMDGNGRWAKMRGLDRIKGHEAGAKSIRAVVKKCIELKVRYLTLFAFSIQNWGRPADEVSALMALLSKYLLKEKDELLRNGIRLVTIGQTDRLFQDTRKALREVIRTTSRCKEMTLILALSYGAKEEILRAVRNIVGDVERGKIKRKDITEGVFSKYLWTRDIPDPELIIRTSGEMRLSNFLLYQSAYSELVVFRKMWPDFRGRDLLHAIRIFSSRERRFGKLPMFHASDPFEPKGDHPRSGEG